MLPEFWNRVINIGLLAAPFVLAIFGLDITSGLTPLNEIALSIPPIILMGKEFVNLISGWFKATAREDITFKRYIEMTPLEVYSYRLQYDEFHKK